MRNSPRSSEVAVARSSEGRSERRSAGPRRAGTTVTVVRRVDGEERLAELCRMLGAAPDDEAARSHAESLLAKAAAGA